MSKETTPLDKEQRLERNVQYQDNHLQQAFDKVEEYFAASEKEEFAEDNTVPKKSSK